MILTVTMNPSIDIAYQIEHFKLDTTNRTLDTQKTPGGKGLNVTRVLAQLGDAVEATGLIGGKHGEFIVSELEKATIKHRFYQISGETRNCVAILHDGQQTEILEQGPTISGDESVAFLAFFEEILPQFEVVAISGSLPSGIESGYYAEMIAICRRYQIPVVLDTSGQALVQVLKGSAKPTVIKPNIEELSQLLGREVKGDLAVLKETVSDPLFSGIEWIIVSLGANGSFAKHGDRFYKVDIPKIDVVNPTGSGDSTVAGIASGLLHGEADRELLKKANVLGMLNAQEKRTGFVNLENYSNLYNQLTIKEV